jgi:hypothetical protein
MPAASQQQQKLMGIVRGIQKGTVDPKDVSAKAGEMAKSMKPGEVKKFASTKHKGLPKKVKKEALEGTISELYVVTSPYPGCTPDSLVKPIDPLSGISGTEINPDQVQGVYPNADQAMVIAERMCAEYEEGQRMLEEKKGTTTEKLKKAIDKLEKKRKEHMDAMKEDPKKASDHKEAVANIASKIDDYLTKLEKIEKSKKADEKEKINEAPRVTVQQLFTSLDSKNLSNDKLEDLEYVKKLIDTILDKEYDTVADNPEELAKDYISKRKKDKK